MARQKVTVALSADGGDEIFAGYPKYFKALKRIEQLNKIPAFIGGLVPASVHSRLSAQNKWSKFKDYYLANSDVKRFDIISQATTFYETQRLLNKDIVNLNTPFDEGGQLLASNDLLSKFQAIEYKTYMVDDILQKVDRASMSVSLEGREPFLDQRLIEFVAQLPSDYKYRNGVGKYLLKEIVHAYVPKEMMERPKMGFGVPLENWLRKELKHLLLDVLDEQYLQQQGIFNVAHVVEMRDKYLKGESVEFQRLSYLFLFQLWYKKWMN
jgi:asparagine synthase (glutamine-hydrolysing)